MMSAKVEALGKKIIHFGEEMDFFPERIRQLLESDWTNPEVLEFLLAASEICRILVKSPADFEMLELVYFGCSPRGNVASNGVDKWLAASLSGQALRDRLRVVSAWTAEHVMAALKEGQHFTVLDLGAGPAPYAFETLQGIAPQALKDLKWKCVDIDAFALAEGAKRARQQGLDGVLEFKRMDFLSLRNAPDSDDTKADFGLLVGILCGMTPEEAVSCLIKIKPFFRSGAELIVPTLLNRAFEEDARVFRVLCNVLGWQLKPKSLDEVREVFVSADYHVNSIFSERADGNGQYAIVHATIV
jgi:hypothetical protein